MNINSTIISVGLRSRGELWQLNKIKARFQAKYGELVKLRVVSSYNGPKSVMYLCKMRLALVLLIKYAIIMTSIHFVKINIAWTIARVLYLKMLQFFGTQITNKQVVILYLQVKYLFFSPSKNWSVARTLQLIVIYCEAKHKMAWTRGKCAKVEYNSVRDQAYAGTICSRKPKIFSLLRFWTVHSESVLQTVRSMSFE